MAGSDPFVSMTMPEANTNCGRRVSKQIPADCAACDSRVILHCEQCMVQVTGCICSEVARFGNAEAVERAFERWGEQEGRKRLQRAGVWLPPEKDN